LVRLTAALLLVCGTAAAEPFVHASLAADLTGDGTAELAVVIGGPQIALAIWSQDHKTHAHQLISHGPAIGWTQLNEDARLEVTPSGSLTVTTSNYGIGRNKWEQTLTIAWREGAFRVAGLTHSAFDSLDPEGGGCLCDVNLLTGKGVTTYPRGGAERAVTRPPGAPRIEDWTPEMMTQICEA